MVVFQTLAGQKIVIFGNVKHNKTAMSLKIDTIRKYTGKYLA